MPEHAVVLEPAIDLPQRLRIESIEAVASGAVFLDEARSAQQAQMLRNGGAGNGKGAGDLARGLAAVAEEVKDGAAGGIGECTEDGIGEMSNRTVSHDM